MTQNIIEKDGMAIGFRKDLENYACDLIRYCIDNNSDGGATTGIIEGARILEELMDYSDDNLLAICDYDDGTSYVKPYGQVEV